MIKLVGFTPENETKIEVVGLRLGEKLYEELLNDSVKTLPTPQEKIMIAEELYFNFDMVRKSVDDLINSIEVKINTEMVAKMKASSKLQYPVLIKKYIKYRWDNFKN